MNSINRNSESITISNISINNVIDRLFNSNQFVLKGEIELDQAIPSSKNSTFVVYITTDGGTEELSGSEISITNNVSNTLIDFDYMYSSTNNSTLKMLKPDSNDEVLIGVKIGTTIVDGSKKLNILRPSISFVGSVLDFTQNITLNADYFYSDSDDSFELKAINANNGITSSFDSYNSTDVGSSPVVNFTNVMNASKPSNTTIFTTNGELVYTLVKDNSSLDGNGITVSDRTFNVINNDSLPNIVNYIDNDFDSYNPITYSSSGAITPIVQTETFELYCPIWEELNSGSPSITISGGGGVTVTNISTISNGIITFDLGFAFTESLSPIIGINNYTRQINISKDGFSMSKSVTWTSNRPS